MLAFAAQHSFDSLDTPSEAAPCSVPLQQLEATAGVGTNVFTVNVPAKTKPPVRSKTITARPTTLFVLKRVFIFPPYIIKKIK